MTYTAAPTELNGVTRAADIERLKALPGTPTERRRAGVQMVLDRYQTGLIEIDNEVSSAVLDIRSLKCLGRSAGWKDAVEAWAQLIADTARDGGRRQWALVQGAVWACNRT